MSAELGTIPRAGGTPQLAVNGFPAYYSSGQRPGDTNGQGVGDIWWVFGADGEPIEDAAPEAALSRVAPAAGRAVASSSASGRAPSSPRTARLAPVCKGVTGSLRVRPLGCPEEGLRLEHPQPDTAARSMMPSSTSVGDGVAPVRAEGDGVLHVMRAVGIALMAADDINDAVQVHGRQARRWPPPDAAPGMLVTINSPTPASDQGRVVAPVSRPVDSH